MEHTAADAETKGLVFAIDQTAVHDGPGLRMAVYLKGCPLRCVWCHSPESIRPDPEVVWYETRCQRCGLCVEACPEGVRRLKDDRLMKENGCRVCGSCVDTCPAQAAEMKGQWMTAGEIADQAARVKPFFDRSGGGVTLIGGEPMLQAEFSWAVAALCRENGIHVAMETTGFTPWEKLERVAGVVDLFLFDLKHADDAKHREYTGVPNHTILDNLKRLTGLGAQVIVRVPVIPGRNGSADDIEAICRAAMDSGASCLTLLPCNPAAAGKYGWLSQDYPLAAAKRQTDEEMEALETIPCSLGLTIVPA